MNDVKKIKKSRGKELKEFKLAEEQYQRILEQSFDGTVVYQDGKIVNVDKKAAKLFGFADTKELIGRSFMDFVHPDYKDFVQNRFGNHIGKDGASPLLEEKLLLPDGTEVNVELVGIAVTYYNKPAVQIFFRDITGRVHAEEALKESEEKYRSLIERVNEIICIIQDQKIQYVSPQVTEILGYTPEELREDMVMDYVHPDHREMAMDIYRKRLEGKELPPRYELKLVHRDGRPIYSEIGGGLITYKGKPADFALIRDITERKSAEDTLSKSEEGLNTIFHGVKEGMVFLDKEGRISKLNKRIIEVGGYTEEELKGAHFTSLDMFPPESMEKMIAGYEKVIMHKSAGTIEVNVFTKTGEEKIVELLGSSVMEGSELKGVVVSIRDVTEQKKTEEALCASEEKFRAMVENSHDIIMVIDADGKINYISPSVNRILGYKNEELKGTTSFDFCHPEDLEYIMESFERVIQNPGKPITIDLRIIDTEENWHTVEATATNLLDDPTTNAVVVNFHDVTKRRQAEEALRESEEQLRRILDSMTDSIHLVDRDLTITMVNESFQNWLGYLEYDPDVCGKYLLDTFKFLPAETKDEYEHVFKTGKTLTTEEKVELNGNEYFTETIKIPIKERGEIKNVVTVIRNITERKKAEEELRQSAFFLETIPEVVLVTTSDADIIKINRAFKQIWGYDFEEVKGKSAFSLFAEEEIRKNKQEIEIAINTGDTRQFETIALTKTGDKVPVSLSGSALKDENGKMIGLIAVIEDITERKKAEDALKRKIDFEKTVSAVSSRFINVSNIDTAINESLSEIGKFSDASRSYVFLFKDDGETMDNTHEWCAENVEPQIGNLKNILTASTPWSMKKIHEGKFIHIPDVSKLLPQADSEKEILQQQNIKSLLLIPLYIEGEISGFIGFDNVFETGGWENEDITILRIFSGILGTALERKNTEKNLIEERNRAELYLDILSHDINNLNQAIISANELLSMKLSRYDENRKYSQITLEQAKAVSELINNVHKLSELKVGKVEPEAIEISKIIERSIDRVGKIYPERDIRITHEIPESELFVSGNQLVQDVFDNILCNAVKFNRNDVVEIDVAHTLLENNEYCRIECKDNGPGIPDEMKIQIFERLKRGDKSVYGSGLGLTIAREVISRFGGKIWVEDRVSGKRDKGSNFVVLLPSGELT